MNSVEVTIAGKTLRLETGVLAGQASGAVLVRYGDTLVLCTAVVSSSPREGIDFFPLTVDMEEKLYAAGKIPGGFPKREGRPSEQAILSGRLVDRPIRPLFPKGFRNDVQVVCTVLSADQENAPDILAVIGASAALSISETPFLGPVAAVRVGYINDELVINPTIAELKYSALDLVVAGTSDAVMMVEAGALEVSEAIMLEAIRRGHEALQPLIDMQNRLVALVGKPKVDFPLIRLGDDVKNAVRDFVAGDLRQAILNGVKQERDAALDSLRDRAIAQFEGAFERKQVVEAFESELKRTTRALILNEGIRPDGRNLTTVRPISCDVGLLPRTHGSGLFTRGQTQVLSIVTLGPMSDKQILDTISPEESKRFMHQYNFPPYSVGEARPLRSPGRREIGHGALAERSVSAVVPSESDFPYAIRVVSEVLSSNGSTSMGSVCASILALMDAGVPISAPVAGVAMGLITGENGAFAVLTDIQGMEDALGDMDFKVAGTAAGITGLQMDIKVKGITPDIMETALAQALEGRLFILDKMMQIIDRPRGDLSALAPRIIKIMINPDKIGALIGPGGKTIRRIQEETKVTIEVEDDGTVLIASNNGQNAAAAVAQVQALTEEVEIGKVYSGTVKRLMSFGAFVEVLPGKEGLVRMGELSNHRVDRVEDVVSVGDPMLVKVIEIDAQGRVNLSHRQTIEGEMPAPPFQGGGGDGPRGGGRPQGGGGFRRPYNDRGGDRRDFRPAPAAMREQSPPVMREQPEPIVHEQPAPVAREQPPVVSTPPTPKLPDNKRW